MTNIIMVIIGTTMAITAVIIDTTDIIMIKRTNTINMINMTMRISIVIKKKIRTKKASKKRTKTKRATKKRTRIKKVIKKRQRTETVTKKIGSKIVTRKTRMTKGVIKKKSRTKRATKKRTKKRTKKISMTGNKLFCIPVQFKFKSLNMLTSCFSSVTRPFRPPT